MTQTAARMDLRRLRVSLAGVAACGGLLALPTTAKAHLVTSGAGPFYDGVAHFFVSPEDVLVVVALALFGGLSGRRAARRMVLLLPAAWMLGAMLGQRLGEFPEDCAWIPAACMLIAGLLLAASPRCPASVPAAAAAGIGLVHGLLNGRAMAATNTSLLAATGIVVALGLVTLLLGALATAFSASWQKITARVIGSWVAAIGILALAWSLRPPQV